MQPLLKYPNVSAQCPACLGSVTTYESRDGVKELGTIIKEGIHSFNNDTYTRIIYMLLKCASCGRGGLATIHHHAGGGGMFLEEFYPASISSAQIPVAVPDDVVSELREAELCAAHGAWRASSALIRSVLEKTLKNNGYDKGNLASKIDLAASDGILTEARKKRAHDEIRVLGNDILHDEWRPVDEEEYRLAHHYGQRILEDFYDDRPGVEIILKAKNRIP